MRFRVINNQSFLRPSDSYIQLLQLDAKCRVLAVNVTSVLCARINHDLSGLVSGLHLGVNRVLLILIGD